MADGSRTSATDVSRPMEELYGIIQQLRQVTVEPGDPNDIYLTAVQLTYHLLVGVVDEMMQASYYGFSYFGMTFEGTVARLNSLSTLFRCFLRDLSHTFQLDTFDEELRNQFRAFLICLTAELVSMFGEMTEVLALSEEVLSRYNELISSMRWFSLVYSFSLETSVVADEPFSRLNHLHLLRNELSEALNTPLMVEQQEFLGADRGASEEIIEKNTTTYKYQKVQKSEDGESSLDFCVICQCNIEEEEIVRLLPCKHLFHKTCADKWLESSKRCPLCRTNIDEEVDALPLQAEDSDTNI